jgi:hypothetical protein
MKTKNKLINRAIAFFLVGLGVALLVYTKQLILGCLLATVGYFIFLKND